MLTENEARELLSLAARTIEVPDGAPLPTRERRRGWPVVAAAAAVLVVAGAIGVAVLDRSQGPTHEPGVPVTSSPSTADLVTTPAVVGLSPEVATARLQEVGLGVQDDVLATFPGHFCTTGNVVVGQDPAAGSRVQPGTLVTIETTWKHCDGSPALPGPDDPAALGRLFVAFAHGTQPGLLIENPVRLYLGDRFARVLPAAQASDPTRWNACIRAGYADRSCPLSATATLASYDGALAYAPGPAPSVDSCTVPRDRGAPATGGTLEVTVRPSSPATCLDDFEVQIYTEAGRVVAVNLRLGAP